MRLIVFSLIWFWVLVTHVVAGPTVQYEIIGRFNEAPGNLTVTPDGRIIMSLQQFYEPRYSVVEILPDNSLVAFPNLDRIFLVQIFFSYAGINYTQTVH